MNDLTALLQEILDTETWNALMDTHRDAVTEGDAVAVAMALYRERSLRNPKSLAVAAELLDRAESAVNDQTDRVNWAVIQFHRGEVTWYRAFLDPKQTGALIEDAIRSYQKALTVYTMTEHPREWAHTLESLSLMYIDRVEGSRRDNLAAAIGHMQDCIRVYTEKTYPDLWANIMINLGSAYAQIPGKDAAENMEKAIECLTAALRVYTRENNPVRWASLQVNLGTAYQHRVRGNTAENIEETIRLYENALTVFTREAFPERFAMMNSNLGNAYLRRTTGDPGDNTDIAIARLETALSVQSRRIPPFHTAMIQLNLANACLQRADTRPALLNRALTLCDKALDICRDNYPVEAAMIYGTRGTALVRRGCCPEIPEHEDPKAPEKKRQHFEAAREAFRSALKVFTPEIMPGESIDRNRSLAEVCLVLGDTAAAADALEQAMTAFDVLYRQNVTVEGQCRVVQKGAPACFLAAYCAAGEGDSTRALNCLERGKTRLLSSRLALDRMVFSDLEVKVREEYEALVTTISDLEYTLGKQGVSPGDYVARTAELKTARQTLDGLIARIRRNSPEFHRKAATYDDIQSLIPDLQTAFVSICITDHGSAVIPVLHPDQQTKSLSSSIVVTDFHSRDLSTLNREWLAATNSLKISERTSNDIVTFQNKISKIIAKIYETFFKELDGVFERLGIRRLVVAPHRFLHVLPLHLMQDASERYLFEKYEIKYVPSGSVWCHVATTHGNEFSDRQHFLGIANPTGDLAFAEPETQAAADYFDTAEILAGASANPEKVLSRVANADVIHVAGHGVFDQNNPEGTGLILARETGDSADEDIRLQKITDMSPDRSVFFPVSKPLKQGTLLPLADICYRMNLHRTRLVVLSACDSGLVITGEFADEVLGLPTGFLQAGADAVVSSLWLVDDAGSRDLLDAFYKGYRHEQLPPGAALQAAQHKMLDAGIGFYYWGGFVVTGGLSSRRTAPRAIS